MNPLEKKFDAAVRQQITTILTTTKYRPTYYMQMVTRHGAFQAAIDLIRAPHEAEGFTKLYDLDRLDLSVEALVIDPSFAELFSQEDQDRALSRLRRFGYET